MNDASSGSARYERLLISWYRNFFSIEEIEREKVLQWVFGASLFTFFISFSAWMSSHVHTIDAFLQNNLICWEYFRSCGDFAFLRTLPEGYSQPLLYMILFGVMLLVVYFMHSGKWVTAHLLLSLLFLWKFLVLFALTRSLSANYDYYHIILTFVLLFLPYKTFFLKFVMVLLYFLAATIKLDEGWILGAYFTTLDAGLPLFSDSTAPFITNLVIAAQIIGAWFLLSNDARLRIGSLAYFTAFHLYSGILVLYRYPATVLPTLLLLFGLFPTKTERPRGMKAVPGWIFVLLLITLQLLPVLAVSKDHKLTLEGNFYGLFMFEANHQCISTETHHMVSGESLPPIVYESPSARNRCDPYTFWFRIQEQCKRNSGTDYISWTLDHSINGGPFYRIIDEPDACALEYRGLGPNPWIKTPEEGAPVVGYPVQNIYW